MRKGLFSLGFENDTEVTVVAPTDAVEEVLQAVDEAEVDADVTVVVEQIEETEKAEDAIAVEEQTLAMESAIDYTNATAETAKVIAASVSRMNTVFGLGKSAIGTASLESDVGSPKEKIVAALEAKGEILEKAKKHLKETWEKIKQFVITLYSKAMKFIINPERQAAKLLEESGKRGTTTVATELKEEDVKAIKAKFAGFLFLGDGLIDINMLLQNTSASIGANGVVVEGSGVFKNNNEVKAKLQLKEGDNFAIYSVNGKYIEVVVTDADGKISTTTVEVTEDMVAGIKLPMVQKGNIETILKGLEKVKTNVSALDGKGKTIKDQVEAINKEVEAKIKEAKDAEGETKTKLEAEVKALEAKSTNLSSFYSKWSAKNIQRILDNSRNIVWLAAKLLEYYPKTEKK